MTLAGVARTLGWKRRNVLPANEAYALWADSYPPWPHNAVMEAEQEVMAPIIGATRPEKALDVGTGTGRYLLVIRAAGARQVVGADLSMAMLGQRQTGAAVVCADAGHLPFADARFDLVVSSLMVGDVENPAVWIDEAARVLVPGGHLVYSDFHPSWSARGWRRTFTAADGRLCELPFFPHAIEQHLELLASASLSVRAIREPRVAGKPAPVVAVFHAVRRRDASPRGRQPIQHGRSRR
jgi:malonyl-CoA O-methyltransferase